MVGITIGVGEKYNSYAREAASRFSKYTNLETLVIGDEELREAKSKYVFPMDLTQFQESCFLKMFVFDLFPKVDNYVYFDSDYCTINHWNPLEYSGREEFICTRDRTYWLISDCWFSPISKYCDPSSYFNGGFYIVNRKPHHGMMIHSRDSYTKIPNRVFHDQCCMNYIVHNLGYKVLYLDRRFNCMDYTGIFRSIDVKAIHNGIVYKLYDRGLDAINYPNISFDTSAMRELSGFYRIHLNGEPHQVNLFYDGQTNSKRGISWFVDQNGCMKFISCDKMSLINPDKICRIG